MHQTTILKDLDIFSNYPYDFSKLKKKYIFLEKNLFLKSKVSININFLSKIKKTKKHSSSIKKINNKILIIIKGQTFKIKNSIFDNIIDIEIEKSFSKIKLIDILDDLIIIKFIQFKLLPVHSSGFNYKKKGFLIAAYGGMGKTSLILEANKFLKKCKIFDEWCLIKGNLSIPFRKEILLMYYDIINQNYLSNKFDFIRAYLFKLIKVSKINNYLSFLKLSLPYKHKYFKNVNSFNIKQVYFLKDIRSPEIFKKNVSVEFISKQIFKNFLHEKKQLIKISRVNNSIISFKRGVNLENLYRNLLKKFLKKCKCNNLFINSKKKNFNKLLKEILIND